MAFGTNAKTPNEKRAVERVQQHAHVEHWKNDIEYIFVYERTPGTVTVDVGIDTNMGYTAQMSFFYYANHDVVARRP